MDTGRAWVNATSNTPYGRLCGLQPLISVNQSPSRDPRWSVHRIPPVHENQHLPRTDSIRGSNSLPTRGLDTSQLWDCELSRNHPPHFQTRTRAHCKTDPCVWFVIFPGKSSMNRCQPCISSTTKSIFPSRAPRKTKNRAGQATHSPSRLSLR